MPVSGEVPRSREGKHADGGFAVSSLLLTEVHDVVSANGALRGASERTVMMVGLLSVSLDSFS